MRVFLVFFCLFSASWNLRCILFLRCKPVYWRVVGCNWHVAYSKGLDIGFLEFDWGNFQSE